MPSAVLRTCAAVAFACFVSPFPQSHEDNPAEARVWLAVEERARGQLRIEPVATVDEGRLTPIQTSCLSDELVRDDPASKYLQPGTKYALLFGGANAGEAVVGEQDREHTASFVYTGEARIRGQVRALATNADLHDFRVASREPATNSERAKALVLAREIFSEHGVPEALLPRVRAEYVTRTYLAPSPQPSLVASFFLDTDDDQGSTHALFFIASQPLEKLQAEVVWAHLSESEMDEERLRFVDHADLFGDGRDEVVTKLVSVATQSHRYVIFRRTKDGSHWEQIFATEPLGCSE